ncbi:hypothetical protein [Actinophytocola sp.]|uniref:hypothetical protein n=1 Tax=Actinophytocola sp. TaxID=1872138 RepID=UPI00389A6909
MNLPIVELMSNQAVVRQFAQVLHDPDDPAMMAGFLRAAMEASASIDHQRLLEPGRDQDEPPGPGRPFGPW